MRPYAPSWGRRGSNVLRSIEGTVPDASEWPSGCGFRTRCPLADEDCAAVPPVVAVDGAVGHRTACWHVDKVESMA